MRPPLPQVREDLFLGKSGFVGYRCDCGFLATGRTVDAVDRTIDEHRRFRHLAEHVETCDEENVQSD